MAFTVIEHLKYITVAYVDIVHSVKLMVQEHYDIPEYKNTFFMINGYDFILNNTISGEDFNGYERKIYYFLEHRMDNNYYLEKVISHDLGFINLMINKIHWITEFWTMDYEPNINQVIRSQCNVPIYYKPLRYTKLIERVKEIETTPKTIDLCHIGVSYKIPNRSEILSEIESYGHHFGEQISPKNYISLKNICGTSNIEQVKSELNTSRYIIDMVRDNTILTQNQVRIFELLCMGYTVCVQKMNVNLFPGLIYEWSTVDDLYEIIKRGEYLHPTEGYKEMTYTNEAYEKYVDNLIKLQNI